jgi:hypothetical protein
VVKKIEHRKPVCGTPSYHYGDSSTNRGWHRYGNEPTSPCALAKSGHLACPSRTDAQASSCTRYRMIYSVCERNWPAKGEMLISPLNRS